MARCVMAIASAPPDPLLPPHCRAWNCFFCVEATSTLLIRLVMHSPTWIGLTRGFSVGGAALFCCSCRPSTA
eukprot:2964175-Lingulodinium_polyedra.AAC.1